MSSSRAPPASIIGCDRFEARRRCARASATARAIFSFGRDAELVAGERHVVEAEHLDRRRRSGFGDRVAVLVEHGPDLAPAATGDDGLADAERAPLDERGDDRPAAGVEVGLEHERPRRCLRVGAQLLFELRVGDEDEAVEQLLDADPRAVRPRRPRGCRHPTPRGRAPARRAAGAPGSGSAFSRSILVTATTIGTSAALAWLIASIVWGITPSSAATTRIAMSVASAPRARMAVNASWPGVSMNVIFRPSRSTW